MKRFKLFTLVALVAVLGFSLTSCGGYSNSKAKEFIKKDKKDKLKKEDYATMIEWYEEINEEYYDGWEKIIKKEKKYDDYELALHEFQIGLLADYPHFDRIESILRRGANEGEDGAMGKANCNKYEKLSEKFDKRRDKLNDKAPEPEDD